MKNNKKNACLLFAVLVTLTSCQNNEETADEMYEMKDWKKIAEESKLHTPTMTKRSFKREESDSQDLITADEDTLLPTDPVTLKVKNQPVAVVIRTLAKVAKQNIFIDDTIKSVITLDVENVPWNEVFKGIMKTNSLNYVREGKVIRIISTETVERELKLENLRKQLSQARKESVKAQEMRIRSIELHHLDIDKTAEMVTELLGIDNKRVKTVDKESERPAVVVDHEKNTLIVKAVPTDINKILELIETLDRPATQVLIEARIVMTTNRAARELGVQWGGLMNHDHVWLTPGVNTSGVFEQTLGTGVDPTTGFFSNFPSPSLGGSGGILSDNPEGNLVGSN